MVSIVKTANDSLVVYRLKVCDAFRSLNKLKQAECNLHQSGNH